jgi:two-component system, NarL family, sensor histidine kinase DesK
MFKEDDCRPKSLSRGVAAQRYLALVYTAFFFIDPVFRHSAKHWIAFALVYTLFLALYVSIAYTRGRARIAVILTLFILPFCYVPFNDSVSGMFAFSMATLPFILKNGNHVVRLLVLQVGLIITEGLVLHLSLWNFGLGAFLTVTVTLSNLYFAQKAEADRKLLMAQGEVERLAKTAERERIARDLHDVLGHTLTLVVLKSQVAERLIATDPEKAAEEVRQIQNSARQALSEVREAVLGFRSHGLAAEMEKAEDVLRSAGIAYVHTMDPVTLPTMLSREQEMALTLGVREAVTNVVRHSRASQCSLRVGVAGKTVRMVVSDDGVGGDGHGGFGLKGMRERVEMLGGKLSLDGASGMQLVVEMPL